MISRATRDFCKDFAGLPRTVQAAVKATLSTQLISGGTRVGDWSAAAGAIGLNRMNSIRQAEFLHSILISISYQSCPLQKVKYA
jgi:hypothetical protein